MSNHTDPIREDLQILADLATAALRHYDQVTTMEPRTQPGTIIDLPWVAGYLASAERTAARTLRAVALTAHMEGHTWAEIGAECNISKQAAQQRFGVR